MDLHIHSNLTLDGALSVEEILMKAQAEGVDVISIADHNTALAHVVIEHIDREESKPFAKLGNIIWA
jgi:predicted metal-dependent phosphoesterase TrpH